jgi:hypothetical protein
MKLESNRVQEVPKVTFVIYFTVALSSPNNIRAIFSLRVAADLYFESSRNKIHANIFNIV